MSMTREIKFRGKAADVEQPSSGKMHKAGEWVYGNLCGHPDKIEIEEVIHMSSKYWHIPSTIIDPKTVGQFTGLHDKNGKEIYEGDIIKTKYGRPCVIEWLSTICFVGFDLRPEVAISKYKKPDGYDLYNSDNLEVIGNIYDNPELLKEN